MSDSTQHTQGPFSHGFNLLANFESRDGLRTPVLLLEDEYNRARACWNACDGIDTDALEVTPDINDLYDGVVNERNALRAEVERLRVALAGVVESRDSYYHETERFVPPDDTNDLIGYWSPAASMVGSEHIAAARAALKGGA